MWGNPVWHGCGAWLTQGSVRVREEGRALAGRVGGVGGVVGGGDDLSVRLV